ncbi:MAG: hypothetical protein K2X35_08355 [Bryobacteraceae bacterium]|nr:hypothetical protein [Bryobacteraceae bacterium]
MTLRIWGCLALASLLTAQEMPPPERKVEGQVVTSARNPEIRIEIGKEFRYLGGQRFNLYGVADAEQHFFAEASPAGVVKRLIWLQFEGYLPANNNTYNYSASGRATVSGVEFYADTRVSTAESAARQRAGSDGEWMRKLVAAKGLKLPTEAVFQRLVHLDESKRNELMIIYLEDLAPHGVAAADLIQEGAQGARLVELRKGLLERAGAAMKLKMGK